MTERPSETLFVTFESELHRDLHRVLVAYGFGFTVDAKLRVGREYAHERRTELTVVLKPVDDALEALPLIDGLALTDRSYSVREWAWITAAEGDEPEHLRRELEIQVRVRPRYLNFSHLEAKGRAA